MKADLASRSSEPLVTLIDGRYLGDRYPGIARYLFNLTIAMADLEPDMSLTLLVDPEEPQTRFDVGEMTSRGVTLEPLRGPLQSLRGYLAGHRAGRGRAQAVFHAPHIFSALPAGQPSVVTIHDLIPTRPTEQLRRRRDRALYRLLLRRSLQRADAILAVSPVVAAELERAWGIARDRITLTLQAADPRFGAQRDARSADDRDSEPAAGRRREGSPLDLPPRYVLYVGTDRPHKNLSRLLRAWDDLDDAARDGCKLLVVGASRPRREVRGARADSSQADDVVFLGFIDDAALAEVYRHARLLVHPALQEGFGLPVIEAMASGLPVACSSDASLDPVCGNAALRFDPRDTHGIAAAIARLLRDDELRDRLAAAGHGRAAALSWSRTAKLTVGVYRKVMRRHAMARAGV